MAVDDIVPFDETPASASSDLLREMIKEFAQPVMDAASETLGRDGGTGDPEAAARDLLPRSGPWSGTSGPSGRWPPWWRRRTCWVCPRGGGEAGGVSA